MSDDKVIQFPKRKSKGAEAYRKAEAKQIFLSLSIVALVVASIMVNDNVTSREKPLYLVSDNNRQMEQINRAIASARPHNPMADIEWEHNLAKKLGNEPEVTLRYPASVAKKLTLLDQLRYGPLAGKYRIVNVDFRVEQIQYVESLDTGDQPVKINPEQFLKEYGDVLAIPFAKSEPHSVTPNQAVYRLFSEDGQPVGLAKFQFDSEENFIGLTLSQPE